MKMQKIIPRAAFQKQQGLRLVQPLRLAGEIAGRGFGLYVRVGIFQQGRAFGHDFFLKGNRKARISRYGLEISGAKDGT